MTNPKTNFTDQGIDLGDILVTKEYVMDVYPNLLPAFNDNTLWVWGYNTDGQLGTNDTIHRSSPVQTVAGGTNWKQVSTTWNSTAAIKTDGTLWMWGHNSYGRLGTNDEIHRSSPVQTVAGGTNWKSVSCGTENTAAIKTDGTLWVWGNGLAGLLGTNDTISRSSPVQTVAGGTNWKSVSVTWTHTAAIKTDGTLWVWGTNDYGRLGTNDLINRSSPVQTIAGGNNWKQVSCDDDYTAAIKTDGTLWVWGYNYNSQLGTNDRIHRSSPVQTIAGGTNWKQVSCGGLCTAAIKTDGTLWVWGHNSYGQLGTNDTIHRSSPVQTVAGGTNWKQVSCGGTCTTAIKTDGTLWVWGHNSYGRLGTNDEILLSSPVQTVAGGTNWKQVGCGATNAAAIKDETW